MRIILYQRPSDVAATVETICHNQQNKNPIASYKWHLNDNVYVIVIHNFIITNSSPNVHWQLFQAKSGQEQKENT